MGRNKVHSVPSRFSNRTVDVRFDPPIGSEPADVAIAVGCDDSGLLLTPAGARRLARKLRKVARQVERANA